MSIVTNIKKALSYNISAYDSVKQHFRSGMTELDVRDIITAAYLQSAGSPVDFEGDIVGGARSAEIGGEATANKLTNGTTLILDLLPGCQGCFCDTTRTFFIGAPTEEMQKIYSIVLRALQAGESMLRPGIQACEVYRTVRDALAPFDRSFPHHAGHRIGTGRLMEPDFTEHCRQPLQEGMVVTLEPGVYIKGRFGIRLENNYLITKNGCENLFFYPLTPEYFIL